jgi:hypothetical protein
MSQTNSRRKSPRRRPSSPQSTPQPPSSLSELEEQLHEPPPIEEQLHEPSEPAPAIATPDVDASDDDAPSLLPTINEDTIRAVLDATGKLLHQAAGRTPNHWLFLEEELDLIAPPLARRARKSSMLRKVAGSSDAYIIVLAFAGYGIRNLRDLMPDEATKEADGGSEERFEQGVATGGNGFDATSPLAVPGTAAPG